jgi:hypothetical protein
MRFLDKFLFYVVIFSIFGYTGYGQSKRASAMIDGPYVFYNGDSIIVKSIIEENGENVAKREVFSQNKKSSIKLHIRLSEDPAWNFEVSLDKQVKTPACESEISEKPILILSDIEGEFKPFRQLLLTTKVIDKKYNWKFGKGRLIIAGDLFDRGKQVCQYLWLLYKLEQEAATKGGEVHVILGNHDIMNLSNDYGYVQPEYFTDAELIGERYKLLYGSDTELGRWLRSKNIIEKIGELLVVHGGISAPVNQLHMSLALINKKCRPYFEVANRRDKIPDDTLLRLFAYDTSPFWYRGYFLEPKASNNQIDSTLKLYHVNKVIVGHDIIDHVGAFYNDKVIGVDVDEHEGIHEALLIDKGKYYRVDDKDNKVLIIN